MEWTRLNSIKELNRSEHTMHVFSGKVYIVGGYSFRNHLASEIFHHSEVMELEIQIPDVGSPTASLLRKIELNIEGPYCVNFSSMGTLNHIYLYGGYEYPDYNPTKQDMYKFCPPYTDHNKRPKRLSILHAIDLQTLCVQTIHADQKFATADGTLQVLSKKEDNSVENLLIVGGTSGRIDLYTTFNFDIEKCDLLLQCGGCKVDLTTEEKDSLMCILYCKIIH